VRKQLAGNLSFWWPGNLRGICRRHKKLHINFYLNRATGNKNPKWIVATRKMSGVDGFGGVRRRDNFYNSAARWKFNFIFNLMLQRATNVPFLQRITLNLLLFVKLFLLPFELTYLQWNDRKISYTHSLPSIILWVSRGNVSGTKFKLDLWYCLDFCSPYCSRSSEKVRSKIGNKGTKSQGDSCRTVVVVY